MSNEKSTVITVYGRDKVIDKIAVSIFEKSEPDRYGSREESNAETYCNTINNLELQGDSWISAKIISQNTQYDLDSFIPLRFDVILKLDNMAICIILRECGTQVIALAMKGESEAVHEKIFHNMSKRAAQILREDMECLGSVPKIKVKEAQEKIISIIRHLEQYGEIIIPYSKGDIVV